MPVSIYTRIFVKAAEILGGRSQLGRHLQVPGDELAAWIEGKRIPPRPMFLKAIDIVLEELDVKGSEPGDTPPSQDASAATGDSTRY